MWVYGLSTSTTVSRYNSHSLFLPYFNTLFGSQRRTCNKLQNANTRKYIRLISARDAQKLANRFIFSFNIWKVIFENFQKAVTSRNTIQLYTTISTICVLSAPLLYIWYLVGLFWLKLACGRSHPVDNSSKFINCFSMHVPPARWIRS